MELVLLSQSCGPQPLLALVVAHHWQVNLLEDHLVLPCRSKPVLAPPSSKTCGPIKQFISLRKIGGVNVAGQDKVLGGKEDSEIILKITSIKFWMYVECLTISVLMWVWFCLVLSVPLPTPDL